MHVVILLLACFGAWVTRWWCYGVMQRCLAENRPWRERWSWALGAAIAPALWLAIAVVAVCAMGTHGTMFGHGVSAIGLWLSVGFAIVAVVLLASLAVRAWQIQRELRRYPEAVIESVGLDRSVRIRPVAAPSWFAGQVGLLSPELAIGQTLLASLDREQIDAIVAHECAHARYRDTLVFFVLGWLRRLTGWLPHTRELWRELVLLRELRADRWAAQFVDPLLLAETLVAVARSASADAQTDRLAEAWAGFHDFSAGGSFEARIEALIAVGSEPKVGDRATTFAPSEISVGGWLWFALACFPLLALPFHHV